HGEPHESRQSGETRDIWVESTPDARRAGVTESTGTRRRPAYQNGGYAYDQWIASLGLPIYRGYFLEDLRAIELGRWEERGCDSAFVQLSGQEGVVEARVCEIGPGKT